jgi:adenylate cyclase
MSFFGEIKRRKVVQVAAGYAVVAWLVIQIVVSIKTPLNLPPWTDTLVIVLVAIGFPLALVLSWAYDITARGIVRTEPASPPDEALSPSLPIDRPAKETLPNSVAVLPFENLSPNSEDAYFAAGIHEELLNELAKLQDLKVIARTSVMKYENARRSIAEIAEELHVGTIMEGSVRYAGNRVRVTAQLIEAKTEAHLWSEVYERDLADVFAIQADIAKRIATELEAKFSGAEQQSLEKPPTQSPVAYAVYLQAMALVRAEGVDEIVGAPQLHATLQSRLDQAIALDPEFALPYAYRARMHVSALRFDIGSAQADATRVSELENLALADLDKALSIDPKLGFAHATMARIHQGNWRKAEAAAAYERAIELRPNDPEILAEMAFFEATIGQPERAVRLGRKALTLDPGSGPLHYLMAVTYMHIHDKANAVSMYRRGLELAPTNAVQRANLAALEFVLGNETAALEEAKLSEQMLGQHANPAYVALIAYAFGLCGAAADAKRLFARFEEIAATRRVAAAAWAWAYLAVGDSRQALHWIKVLGEHRYPYEAMFAALNLEANWFDDPILEQPEFVAARRKLGFRVRD